MALAGWQLARHQLHILVSVFISRTLHVPLGQECVPDPLREVPDLGIGVHKQINGASRNLSASVALSQLAQGTWLLLSNRRHVGVLVPWRLPTAHLDYGLLAPSRHHFA